MNNSSEKASVFKKFQDSLNLHGYGFQYAVLKAASDLSAEHNSHWEFEVSEFPVNVKGYDTRIDFILINVKYPIHIIAECKRANPALMDWCFIRAPFVHRLQKDTSRILVERIRHDWASPYRSEAYFVNTTDNAYHVAREIKSSQKGDRTGSGRGAIEEAATQVCRGLNGYVNYINTKEKFIESKKWIDLFPVIFTTAKLWVCDADLSKAQLIDGKMDFNETDLIEKDWIWYQFHQSVSLKHDLPLNTNDNDLHTSLEQEFIRSIAIVNPKGIKNFLFKLHDMAEFIKGTSSVFQ